MSNHKQHVSLADLTRWKNMAVRAQEFELAADLRNFERSHPDYSNETEADDAEFSVIPNKQLPNSQ